jgi:hypothetical protein
MFDWSYPQFAAGILPHPAYAADFESNLHEAMKQRAKLINEQDSRVPPLSSHPTFRPTGRSR